MIALIIVAFIAVGVIELRLWPQRPLKETIIYLVLLAAAAAFAILIVLKPDLPVPSPYEGLLSLFKKIRSNGG